MVPALVAGVAPARAATGTASQATRAMVTDVTTRERRRRGVGPPVAFHAVLDLITTIPPAQLVDDLWSN